MTRYHAHVKQHYKPWPLQIITRNGTRESGLAQSFTYLISGICMTDKNSHRNEKTWYFSTRELSASPSPCHII